MTGEETPRPGQTLGPYRIIEQIGAGGMGAVYRAEEQPSQRTVALKVLPKQHVRSEEALRRFRQEAEAAFRLSHPNIVRGNAAGEDGGFAYYVMELCDGESLDLRLKREGPLPWREALGIAVQIGQALRYAHGQGVIHRDLKPSNILVGADGQAKLLDLGLSKRLIDLDASYRTETGAAMGTPHYMSPEQARGARDVDGRADIYGLGATLFHLMTGRVPFPGASVVEIVAGHLKGERPDPKALVPEIPAGVSIVVRRMMAREVEDRYRDCSALLADLERILQGKPPTIRVARRLPWFAVAGLVAVLLAGAWMAPGRGGPDWATAVDLLSGLDVERQAVHGRWTVQDGGLVSTSLSFARIQLPYEPPEEYDFMVEFTRSSGTGAVALLCSRQSKTFTLETGSGIQTGFFTMVDLPSRVPPAVTRVPVGGRRHTILVEVRKQVCRAFMDSELLLEWKSDFAEVSGNPLWKVGSDRVLGLGASDCVAVFHRALVRDVTGRGRRSLAPEKPPPPPPPRAGPDGLIGYWPLDEGDGRETADASPFRRTARLNNGASWAEGKLGKALRFRQQGEWAIIQGYRLEVKALTLAAWVKHDTFDGMYQRYITLSPEVAVLREVAGGRLHFYINLDGRFVSVQAPNALRIGEWTHVAGTWDGQMARVYRNGLEVGSRIAAGTLAESRNLDFGAPKESLIGTIDDVRVYNRALSAAEIATLAGLDAEKK